MLFFLFSVGVLDLTLVDHTLSPYADTTGKKTLLNMFLGLSI